MPRLCYFSRRNSILTDVVISLAPTTAGSGGPTFAGAAYVTLQRTLNRESIVPGLTIHDIRRRFESSTDFNEIFEAFEHALRQRIDDIGLYRQLFWNHSLSPDELKLFGEKLSREFAPISYDVFMWLASVFEATTSMNDNYDLAVEYYRKASRAQPAQLEPYLYAADCYEPDLNIPPISVLINFLKEGTQRVPAPKLLFQRLAHLYEKVGNDEMTDFCRRKAQEGSGAQDAPPEL